ncbi:hypothetical protein [Pseudomonas sp. R37(2017)]|uniref:hypothetical protein n=1 Tax=Pseudomonas sp. R37(2017) TaxID=1981685 RepID=UPI000A1DBB6B|nr:hypothetical protein [Pseudomonas sp. R37(2017)]
MNTATTIDDALLDVRKAYRFLADYQQRVLELLGFIRKELSADHYHQVPRNRIPRNLEGIDTSNNVGQRFLPFNDISVLWLRNTGQEDPVHFHQKDDLLIDIWVRSDTGNGTDNEPAQSAEQSRSELRIYFFQCVVPLEKSYNWYSQVWAKTNYPPLCEVAVCDDNPGYRAYGETLCLSTLTDATSTRTALTELRQRASIKLGQTI